MLRPAIEEQIKQADKALGAKTALNSMWQDFAENFLVERATFTIQRSLGQEFADHLASSEPLVMARELADSVSTMLRSDHWFEVDVDGEVSHASRQWLSFATEQMRKKMGRRGTGFQKAVKIGDKDWAVFGNAALWARWNLRDWTMNYRAHHLRDCAWREDENGEVCTFYLKSMPTLHQIKKRFPNTIHESHLNAIAQNEGDRQAKVYYIEVPIEEFGDESYQRPYLELVIDVENQHVLEERNVMFKECIVPRFATETDSVYGYSPAVMCAIPDARLMQAMAWTMIDAGERFTKPPLLGVSKALPDGVNLLSDGISWVDENYEGKLDQVLRPLFQDRGGFGAGLQIQDSTRQNMRDSFYDAAMKLPIGEQMTAFEVQERVREFIRKAKPLFEPVEIEYNGGLCEATFNQMMLYGDFGPLETIPLELSEKRIQFKFRSPIHEAEERSYGAIYDETLDRVQRSAAVDPSLMAEVDLRKGLRDATSGSGAPDTWLNTEETAKPIREMILQTAAARQQMAEEAAAG